MSRGLGSGARTMTSRLSRWTTVLVTFAGIGLPWLFARKALDTNDPAAQAVAFLPAPYAFIIWAPIYTNVGSFTYTNIYGSNYPDLFFRTRIGP